MSSIESSSFFKTLALVSAGAMFGYTIAKGRFLSDQKPIKHSFNFNDVNRIEDPNHLLKFVREKLKNYPSIIDRKFVRVNEKDARDPNEFRIMQWNILARSLCYIDEHTRAPNESYDWSKYRLWRTLEELVRHDCDILCIEEADVYEEIKPYLHKIGYTSIFCPKFFSPCLEMESHVGPDGCAIFYRLSKFEPVNMSCEKIVINNEINSQVFIIKQLKHKQTNKLLTLVCLHLKSKEKFHEKREAQIKQVIKSLREHLYGSFDRVNDNPVILCGDFNGEPFEKFFEYIESDDELQLKDVYSLIANKKQPTTFKYRQTEDKMIQRAIDYIFFTSPCLKLTEWLALPTNDLLINEQGLPNLTFSSDHLSLVASFKFNH